jgi:chorismate synthase
VLDGAGEVAAEPELMDDLASELPATEPEEQDSVEVAPEDHEDTKDPEDDSLASPLGIENGDPVITDVEFTPLDSIELESAAVAIEPQEAAKEAESTDLDPQIG